MANQSGIAYDVPHPLNVTDIDAGPFARPDFAFVCASMDNIIH